MKIYEISIDSFVLIRRLWVMSFLLVLASICGQIAKFNYGHGRLKGFVHFLI